MRLRHFSDELLQVSMSSSIFRCILLLNQFLKKLQTQSPLCEIWVSQVALVVKNLLANVGDTRDLGLIPQSGRFPGVGNDPTPILLPGKFYEQRNLVGYSPWGPKELNTNEQMEFGRDRLGSRQVLTDEETYIPTSSL